MKHQHLAMGDFPELLHHEHFMVSVLQNERKKFNKSSIALKVLCCLHFQLSVPNFGTFVQWIINRHVYSD